MKFFIIPLIALLMTACTYYQATPGGTYSTLSKFDRSWSAAVGALADQDVRITTQDRGAGIIQGNYNGTEVTGDIRTQANGSIRVQFNTSGNANIIDRITRSYNDRMGR